MKRSKSLKLTLRERSALREYIAALVGTLPNEVETVILFGSKARGDSHQESDADVAVVLRGGKTPRLRYLAVSPSVPAIVKYGVDISPIVISGPAFHGGSPFVERIKKEGIELWSPGKNRLTAA